jgi:hypothetical protein
VGRIGDQAAVAVEQPVVHGPAVDRDGGQRPGLLARGAQPVTDPREQRTGIPAQHPADRAGAVGEPADLAQDEAREVPWPTTTRPLEAPRSMAATRIAASVTPSPSSQESGRHPGIHGNVHASGLGQLAAGQGEDRVGDMAGQYLLL